MSSLAQLILFGLLATCATGFFVEESSSITQGAFGQPKWTLRLQLKYLKIVDMPGVVKSPPFNFIINGQPINMTVGFRHLTSAPTSPFQISMMTGHKQGKEYSFRMNGNITLYSQNGGSNVVRPYDWPFSSSNPNYPFVTLANKNAILNPANGWIKDGQVVTSITIDY